MAFSLTSEQLALARVIYELTAVTGQSPSLSELAAEMACNKGNVVRLLHGLEERGWITRRHGAARSIVLLETPPPIEECDLALTEAGVAAIERRAEVVR